MENTVALNEPIAAKRRFDLDLQTPPVIGSLPTPVTGAAGAAVIAIVSSNSTTKIVDSASTITELTTGVGLGSYGPYRVQASLAAASVVGDVAVEVSCGGPPLNQGVPVAWQPSTVYAVGTGVGTRVTNGGNVYLCITGGTSAGSVGPSGTGSNITDNTVHWEYLGPAFGTVHGSFKVAELDCLYYGAVTAVPNATTLNLDMSSPGGSASNVAGYYASASAGRIAIARIVYGTGAGQYRFVLDYQVNGGQGQAIIDSAFLAIDTTSVIRIEDAPGASAALILSSLLATVMDPNNVGNAQYPPHAQTFQQQWNLMFAYMFAPRVGNDDVIGSIGVPSIGAPTADPPPQRAAFTNQGGNVNWTALDGR